MELHRGSNAVLSCNKNFIALLSGPYLPSHRFWKILFNLSLTDSKIHLLSSTLVMRRILMTALAFCLVHFAFAQNDSTAKKTTTTKKYAPGRSNDHFLMQERYRHEFHEPQSIRPRRPRIWFHHESHGTKKKGGGRSLEGQECNKEN